MTPTDINAAINRKLSVLKFFPAEAAGGVKTLKAISGPYGSIKFVPTGGITLGNLEDYLSLPNVVACGEVGWLRKIKFPVVNLMQLRLWCVKQCNLSTI